MRKEKSLIQLLRRIAELLSEEAALNPEFAAKLEALVSDICEKPARPTVNRGPRYDGHVPDIHAELTSRGEAGLRLWLCDQPREVLRAIIRTQDLDPTRRSSKWKETEKLANYIVDNLRVRLARGASFIERARNE